MWFVLLSNRCFRLYWLLNIFIVCSLPIFNHWIRFFPFLYFHSGSMLTNAYTCTRSPRKIEKKNPKPNACVKKKLNNRNVCGRISKIICCLLISFAPFQLFLSVANSRCTFIQLDNGILINDPGMDAACFVSDRQF